ncbi:MAG: nitroreductase family protein [Fimbriimonadaceae bacterium]|nr:nitroreductase family protein [Fimbriimonadaceae bacterium]
MPLPTVPYVQPRRSGEEIVAQLKVDYALAEARRTVREFSSEPVPKEAIETAIRIAGTAPSGAHRQPWTFVAISDPTVKERIREAAEAEERAFYESKITDEWRAALEPLGTDFVKKHLTDAPWLIVVFRQDYELGEDGGRIKNYYMTESVGIAVGFLIQALHRAGLATLTHTPAPMTFLRDICGRPANEKPFLILPVGYAHPDARVPDMGRKSLSEIAVFL